MTWRQQEKKAAKKDGTDCWPKVFACKLCDVTYLATYKHVSTKFHNSKYYSLVSSFSCDTENTSVSSFFSCACAKWGVMAPGVPSGDHGKWE